MGILDYLRTMLSALTSSSCVDVSSINFRAEVSIATNSSPHSLQANLEIVPKGPFSALLVSHVWLLSADRISEERRGFTAEGFMHNSNRSYSFGSPILTDLKNWYRRPECCRIRMCCLPE